MARFLLKDVQAVLRGMRQVARNGLDHQLTEATLRWKMSSLQPLAQNILLRFSDKQEVPSLNLSEIPSRVGSVIQGLREQVKVMTGITSPTLVTPEGFMLFSKYEKFDKASQQKQYPTVSEEDHAKKVGLKQENGEASDAAKRAQQFMNPPVSPLDPEDKNEVVRTPEMKGASASKEENPDDSDQAARRLGKYMNEETRSEDQKYKKDSIKTTLSFTDNASEAFKPEELKKPPSSSPAKSPGQEEAKKDFHEKTHKQTLGPKSRERKVPASRVARLASFGGLAAGLGMGAAAEVARRTFGVSDQKDASAGILNRTAFLTDANAERIVDTLCRVRGAALKLGQMLSIQDTSLLNPQVQQIFERVRQNADFMPKRQMEGIVEREFGPEWRSLLPLFEEKPFAAASIGQVHYGKLKNGKEVAVKIQYPGVAEGIDSDIKNLLGILTMWNIFPKGMYMDNLMKVARVELAWECDYVREAEYLRKFRAILKDDPAFEVPDVIEELSSKRILTTEFIEGEPLDKAVNYSQETRDWVAENFLRLCFEELFVHRLMQTDPNWANFFYNDEKRKIYLLDFGAARTFEKKFVNDYIEIIKGAAIGDRAAVLKRSQALGFLTGLETKALETAHVDAAMILGEPFRTDEPYDFGQQDITKRIHNIIPVMAENRLTPPPDESYSMHRKVAGAFLLCTNLKAKIRCREVFDKIYEQHTLQK